MCFKNNLLETHSTPCMCQDRKGKQTGRAAAVELPRDVNILEIRYSVTVTYVEIYNERVFDLLAVGGKGSQTSGRQAAFSSSGADADENQGRGEKAPNELLNNTTKQAFPLIPRLPQLPSFASA